MFDLTFGNTMGATLVVAWLWFALRLHPLKGAARQAFLERLRDAVISACAATMFVIWGQKAAALHLSADDYENWTEAWDAFASVLAASVVLHRLWLQIVGTDRTRPTTTSLPGTAGDALPRQPAAQSIRINGYGEIHDDGRGGG